MEDKKIRRWEVRKIRIQKDKKIRR